MKVVNIDEVAKDLHQNAVDKGFWDPYSRFNDDDKIIFYLKQLQMITTEVAEVTEAMRKEKGDTEVVRELADIIIRVLDLYGGLYKNGYTAESLQHHILDKAAYNQGRPKMHGVLA